MKSASAITSSKELPAKKIIAEIKHGLSEIKPLLNTCFSRAETQDSALAYLRGLISLVERKNSWQLAEQAGRETPYAFQHLLGRALWNADGLRDEISRYTLDHLGRTEGVLSIDETGFLKKGEKSAGVKRQYSGTAGRIENCQIGVFLSYATVNGRALIDRELYIPQDWFEDEKRCREAGIPKETTFKTKPELAKMMLANVFAKGLKPAWVVGDEVYGCYALRNYLEEQQQPYVLAIASNYSVSIGLSKISANSVLKKIKSIEWKTLSIGEGTKGYRYYSWCRIELNSISPKDWTRWLLCRRSLEKPDEVAFYIAFCPLACTLKEIAKAAGTRWTIEECFEMAKGEVGLDQYEVRSFTGWYRHITLSLLALSLLVKLRYQLNQHNAPLLKKKVQRRKRMTMFLQNRGLV